MMQIGNAIVLITFDKNPYNEIKNFILFYQ